MPAATSANKASGSRLVVKRGAVPPSVYLMHVSDKKWERFIEHACRQREVLGGKYFQVKLLGNARDKGRDVEARLDRSLVVDRWDLYQAKHYANRLTPADAFTELAKFFGHILAKSYPRPRKYHFCSPHNAGPDLHDLLAQPVRFRSEFLDAWRTGTRGLADVKAALTPGMEALVQTFDFSRFEECLVHNLLAWHAVDTAAHYKLFGIEPERGMDPTVPSAPHASEMTYIAELLKAYSEFNGSSVGLTEVVRSQEFAEHFAAARETFYCAEGLRRFSRDLYEEDEFRKLLDMVLKGVKPGVTSPRLKMGLDRLDAALAAVKGLGLTDSCLYPKLRGGDLPGTCHHLANEKQLRWVR